MMEPETSNFFGNELDKAKLEIVSYWKDKYEKTRKALDVANEKLRHCVNITVEELDELKGNLLIAWNALLHFSKDPIANNALKKITALEQKESAFVHNKIEFPEFNDNLLEEFDKQFFENGQDDDLTETALEQKDVK